MSDQVKFRIKFFSPAVFFTVFSVVLCVTCGEAMGWLCLAAGMLSGAAAGILLPAPETDTEETVVMQKPSFRPMLALLGLFLVIIASGGMIASWLKDFYPHVYKFFSGGTIFIIAAMNLFFVLFSLRFYNKHLKNDSR